MARTLFQGLVCYHKRQKDLPTREAINKQTNFQLPAYLFQLRFMIKKPIKIGMPLPPGC